METLSASLALYEENPPYKRPVMLSFGVFLIVSLKYVEQTVKLMVTRCDVMLIHCNAIAHIDGLAQDCSHSIANALELLQSCTKPPNIRYCCSYYVWYAKLNLYLTHWCRVTPICINKLNIIGSDNGMSSGQCQSIFLTNAGILSNGPLGTNFWEMLIKIHSLSFKKKSSEDVVCGMPKIY